MLRTKPARRFHHPYEHIKYGIYKWFAEKGKTNQEYILEICGSFAIENGFIMPDRGDKQKALLTFIHNRFSTFCDYAIKEFNL